MVIPDLHCTCGRENVSLVEEAVAKRLGMNPEDVHNLMDAYSDAFDEVYDRSTDA